MPNYKRPKINGASVFLTATLADRSSELLTCEVDTLREAVRDTRAKWPFKINAFVVLPDHFHCVITLPPDDGDFSTRMRLVKARFSRRFEKGCLRQSHIERAERGVWQRRFWEHHIRDQADFQAHVEYCWKNPVKHRLVNSPMDWPYSTIHRDAKQGIVPDEWM